MANNKEQIKQGNWSALDTRRSSAHLVPLYHCRSPFPALPCLPLACSPLAVAPLLCCTKWFWCLPGDLLCLICCLVAVASSSSTRPEAGSWSWSWTWSWTWTWSSASSHSCVPRVCIVRFSVHSNPFGKILLFGVKFNKYLNGRRPVAPCPFCMSLSTASLVLSHVSCVLLCLSCCSGCRCCCRRCCGTCCMCHGGVWVISAGRN